MAIDASIPLQTRVAPLGNALLSGIQQGQAMRQAYDEKPILNELLQQQKQRGAQQQFNDEQKSIIQGAAQIKPLLDAGDARGALAALQQRKQALQSVGLNTVQTDEAIAMLQSGDVAGLKSSVDSIYQAGLRSGVLQESQPDFRGQELQLRRDQMAQSQTQFDKEMALREKQLAAQQAGSYDTPAAQREAEWYMSLSPEKKAEVDRYRRGDRVAVGTEDKIYKTAVAAEESRQRAVNYDDLASRYEQSDIGSGMFGSSLPEAVKELTGSQDGYTAMRKDWASIKASQVVSNLPPGAASDADVKLALGGFLPDNANPKQVASFMRGIAKLERVRADYESFKSDYMSENKSPVGLNKAWKVYAKQQGIGGPTISSANQQPAPAQQHGGGLSAEDQAALNWAKSNPNDPRAEQIMQLHGGR